MITVLLSSLQKTKNSSLNLFGRLYSIYWYYALWDPGSCWDHWTTFPGKSLAVRWGCRTFWYNFHRPILVFACFAVLAWKVKQSDRKPLLSFHIPLAINSYHCIPCSMAQCAPFKYPYSQNLVKIVGCVIAPLSLSLSASWKLITTLQDSVMTFTYR